MGVGFEDLERRLADLGEKRRRGALDEGRFAEAVGELRAQDDRGRWWALDAEGRWSCWDGAAWQPAEPPGRPAPTGPAPALAPAGGAARVGPATQRALAALQQRTVDPREFARQAREVPLTRRSQGWWDTLAILGGAVGGYLWFVYSSVRGLPLPRFLSSGGRASWFDFFPTMFLLALPVILGVVWVAFGRMLMPVLARLGCLARVLLVAAVAFPLFLLWLWPSVDPWFFPRLFQAREGVDAITPLLTLGIPVFLVTFRKETDALLRPFQPLRQPVPRVLLVGAGLAVPFVISTILYVFGMFMPPILRGFFIQYPYVRVSIVLGTLVSYVILRTPQAAPVPRGMGGMPPAAVRMAGLVALAWLGGAGLLGADDFFRDPFNLNDGLRTNSVAPIIAGALVTVITVLVNGVEVAQVIFQGADPGAKPGEEGPGKRKDFRVVVDSLDAKGARSVELSYDVNPFLFVYAHCEEVGKGRFPEGDASITFDAQWDPRWATLEDLGMAQGRRCAKVSLAQPVPEGTPPPAIVVLVSAGQAVSGVPVSLTIGGGLEVVVKYEPAKGRKHRSFTFERGPEFAADEEDVLKPVVYVRRKGKTPEEVVPAAIELKLKPETEDFSVALDPEYREPNKVRGLVKSARLLLHTGRPSPLALMVEAKVKTPDGGEVELPPFETPLEPRRVFLKLWVIPGAKQGTSEAGAFACLAPSAGQPYAGLSLELKVEGGGQASLKPTGSETVPASGKGHASWDLAYSGLTWANMDAADFKVKVAARTASGLSEATSFEINVGRNARGMVGAMDAEHASLLTDNPYFQGPEWQGITTSLVDKVTSRALRGPFWNIRCMTVGTGPATENTYVCQKFRDRIYGWMQNRRFGAAHAAPETVEAMNGVEISQYAVQPIHVFAGFHLSGTGPDDDPKFIDPWWKQEWGEALTWTDELARCAAVVGPLLAPLAIILAKVAAVASALAAIKAWLLGSWVGYATVTGGTAVGYGVYRFMVGTSNASLSGGVYSGFQNLIFDTVGQWVRERRTVGAVSPVEPW